MVVYTLLELVCQTIRKINWRKCVIDIFYRNNLTVMDAVMVQGQGTTENLRVAGKLPGPGSSLRFKITEALLKDCIDREYHAQEGPGFQPSEIPEARTGFPYVHASLLVGSVYDTESPWLTPELLDLAPVQVHSECEK